MTRNRINIDVNDRLDGWLATTADLLGCTKTEAARAVLEFTINNHLGDPFYLDQIVKEHRRSANRARGQRRSDHHQVPPRSAQ